LRRESLEKVLSLQTAKLQKCWFVGGMIQKGNTKTVALKEICSLEDYTTVTEPFVPSGYLT
jgi:hypothetical protein